MKKLEVNYDNLELIRKLAMYVEDDLMFYKHIKNYIYNLSFEHNLDIEEEQKLRDCLFEISKLIECKF